MYHDVCETIINTYVIITTELFTSQVLAISVVSFGP